MIDFKIKDMLMAREVDNDRSRNQLIAIFTVSFEGLDLRGIELLRTPSNGFSIKTPRMYDRQGCRSIDVFEDKLRNRIITLAAKEYKRTRNAFFVSLDDAGEQMQHLSVPARFSVR